MNIDFTGRTIIITGATGGIGSALASEFYKAGATLALTGRNTSKLEELRNKIVCENSHPQETCPPQPMCLSIDLTAPGADKYIINNTMDRFGRIDALVNNAGCISSKLVMRTNPEYLSQIMNTNFLAAYKLMHTALPYILQSTPQGRIICTTSIAGYMGDAGMSAYAASKGALAAATKSIAAEYGRRGLTANCIAPGVIETEAVDIIPLKRQQDLKTMIPSHCFGKPEDVAYLALFLASKYAQYINGQEIHLNGGIIR